MSRVRQLSKQVIRDTPGTGGSRSSHLDQLAQNENNSKYIPILSWIYL
jgi:hypothetical protein